MDSRESVELREATIEDASLLEAYQIEDTPYTVMPMEAMTDSLHEIEKHPILVMNQDTLVGFFILQRGEGVAKYTGNPHAILLKAHSIDRRYQKKGYAKLSIEKVSDYIRKYFPGVNEVVLAVDYENLSAQMLYLKSGFVNTKKKIKDDRQYKFVFSKTILPLNG